MTLTEIKNKFFADVMLRLRELEIKLDAITTEPVGLKGGTLLPHLTDAGLAHHTAIAELAVQMIEPLATQILHDEENAEPLIVDEPVKSEERDTLFYLNETLQTHLYRLQSEKHKRENA